MHHPRPRLLLLLIVTVIAIACRQDAPATPTPPPPTATPTEAPTATPPPARPQSADEIDFITVAIDAPSRDGFFSDFDAFGTVVGLDPDVMNAVAEALEIDVEFVVTRYEGLLDSVASGEFDAAISAISTADPAPDGIAFTAPYLETGQRLMVLANEAEVNGLGDLSADTPLGYVAFSRGEQVAREVAADSSATLVAYADEAALLQGLVDGEIRAAVVDDYNAQAFAERYYQQLKIADGAPSPAAQQTYAIAVAADNPILLDMFNQALAQLRAEGVLARIAQERLVVPTRIEAGESLIGTPADRIIVGTIGALSSLEPAAPGNETVAWEIAINSAGGLYHLLPSGELAPALARFVEVSDDLTEYTITLRDGLAFSDGTPFTAAAVSASLYRASNLGNVRVNATLKDADLDGRIDPDAVQVIDDTTVRLLLARPTGELIDLLATPPFFVVNPNCPEDAAAFSVELCGGIGPYAVQEWDEGRALRLEVNPEWPLEPPRFDKVEVRFYATAAELRRSLENGSVDVALGFDWATANALRVQPDFTLWEGDAGTFKSYLIFQHLAPPWDDVRVRQAAALAVDQAALAGLFDGERRGLRSPLPSGQRTMTETLPARDLEAARTLLTEAGYSEASPALVTLSYVNDGRYSDIEAEYASVLAEQLAETGLFDVTIAGSPYGEFVGPRTQCELQTYLLAWPPPDEPPASTSPLSWINFFVTATETLCSNYVSPEMDELVAQVRQAADAAERAALYEAVQTLWAEELPTLPLTESRRRAVSLAKVTSAEIDALGLLHFGTLDKSADG